MKSIRFGIGGKLKTGKPAIIAFGWNKWSDYWMPRQQYLFRLGARGWPIVYTAGNIHMRDLMPAMRNRSTSFTSSFRRTSNVEVYQPGLLFPRWPSRPVYDRFAIWNQVCRLKKAVSANKGNVIAFVTHPNFAPHLDHLGDLPVVYFAEDAFSLMPGWTKADERLEEKLVDRADLIVTCAASMAEQLPGDGPSKARILRNGVDYAAFNVPQAMRCPDDLAVISEPRIGYTGSINLKVDFELIAASAKRRPKWNWVLVGPVGLTKTREFSSHADMVSGYAQCRELPNVHFLGPKPFFDLPSYMSNMTVNTMCYRTDGSGWWKAIDPLKTNEYLAAGRPVVSADLVNVRPFSDCIDIACTEKEWDSAIEKALTQDISGRITMGRAKARQNDWNIMTDTFEEMLQDLANTAPTRATGNHAPPVFQRFLT